MGNDQALWLAVGGLAVLCLVLLVVMLRLRASGARSRTEVDALRERLDRIEVRTDHEHPTAASPAAAPVEFVITDLGSRTEPEPVQAAAPAFADIVLKETVVMAASLAHGVRRGLAPANRNRIRFEMKQEVRRSRKQRRSDLKAARRDLHARQRGLLDLDTEEAS
ncbi:MAG: hypothetical protein WAV00_09520 [Nocardioides sp.]